MCKGMCKGMRKGMCKARALTCARAVHLATVHRIQGSYMCKGYFYHARVPYGAMDCWFSLAGCACMLEGFAFCKGLHAARLVGIMVPYDFHPARGEAS
jgi:hypothetical protein